MKLASTVTDIEEVPEQYRDLYTKQGDIFALDLEGVDNHPSVKGLSAAMRKVREQLKEATKKAAEQDERLKEIDELGVGMEELREQLGRIKQLDEKELIEAGKVEELFARRTEELKRAHDRELKKLVERAEAAEKAGKETHTKLATYRVETELRDAAAKAGVRAAAITDVLARGKALFRLDDHEQVVPFDQNGEVIAGKDGTTPMQPEEWLNGLFSEAKHLFEESAGSGSAGGAERRNDSTLTLARDTRVITGRQLEAVAAGKFRVGN